MGPTPRAENLSATRWNEKIPALAAPRWPYSAAPDRDNSGFSDAKEIWWRIQNANTNRISCCKVNPVERALDVGQARCESADHIGIGRNAKSDAVYHGGETFIGTRHEVDIRVHAWPNVIQLSFAEIGQCPPGTRINESKHLLPYVGVCAFGDIEICNTRIEWRVYAAVVQVVLCISHVRLPGSPLID